MDYKHFYLETDVAKMDSRIDVVAVAVVLIS